MKISFPSSYFLISLGLAYAHASPESSTLRQSPGDSSCNAATSQSACFGTTDDDGKPCEWCVAGAIPSECMSQDQASLLPSGVFECTSPGRSSTRRSSYSFVTGKTHTVDAAVLDDDFCDPSSKGISGYVDIKGSDYDKDGENKHLFFWMFEKRGEVSDTTPFVVWLTGGPGCSSTLALLTENGPCSVNKDGKTTTVNPDSWTEAAHVLWLDQPAGVGFSYGEETDDKEAMVAEDAYWFFQGFLQTYPEYSKNPFYVIGESYAGHYVPAITKRIFDGNQHMQASDETRIKINLQGFSIGNGLTNPELQYPAYPEMVFNNSHGIKVVDEATYSTMKAAVPVCTKMIHTCNQGDSMIDEFACQSSFLTCNMALTSPYQATGLNPYDIRIKCAKPPLCYDFDHVASWLNLESTKAALHVDEKHSHSWQSCNFGINMKFHTDWMKDFSGDVAALLDAGIPALIYAGDVDFICN